MMSTVPWVERPTITLDGGLPYAERFKHVDPKAVAGAKELLGEISAELPHGARFLADMIRARTLNRFHAEITALADMAEADWRLLMLANASYSLRLASLGCSTVAIATASGPVLARNMDWYPEDVLARTSYLLRTEVDGRLQFANAGWPGAVGVVTGLSGRGFAVALNAVLSPEGVDRTGYPVLLHIRRVIEDADGFDEAVEQLSEQHIVVGALLTVVGTENDQRVVIERSPRRFAHRRAEGNEPLFATNDYRKLFRTETHDDMEIYRTTCTRFERLERLFADHRPNDEVEDARLLYALTDASVIQGITAQHIILRPREQSVRLFVPREYVGVNELESADSGKRTAL